MTINNLTAIRIDYGVKSDYGGSISKVDQERARKIMIKRNLVKTLKLL